MGDMPSVTNRRRQVDDLSAIKRVLANSMKQQNITISGLAKQLGTGRTAIRRALDVNNTSTTYKTIQRTARALGYAVKLEARPLSPAELASLARKMVNARTTAEGDRLQRQLVQGFFGDAENPA